MPRHCGLILGAVLIATSLLAEDQVLAPGLWREYGEIHSETSQRGKLKIITHEMKDPTGALAAWEWLRSPDGKACDLAPFCTRDTGRTVIADCNYLVEFEGPIPTKAQADAVLGLLPNKRDTSLPAILTFLPRQGLVPDSARYVLGPVSLEAFAPQLKDAKAGFDKGAEAQVAEYRLAGSGSSIHLALFYYATPGMARSHAIDFKLLPNTHVKRSDFLVAVVFGPASDEQADTLLSRVQYEANITWNDAPLSPIKPLYQLLMNIVYLSVILVGICLMAGLFYAGMRIYRRRYGTLEADEAMTTLHLT